MTTVTAVQPPGMRVVFPSSSNRRELCLLSFARRCSVIVRNIGAWTIPWSRGVAAVVALSLGSASWAGVVLPQSDLPQASNSTPVVANFPHRQSAQPSPLLCPSDELLDFKNLSGIAELAGDHSSKQNSAPTDEASAKPGGAANAIPLPPAVESGMATMAALGLAGLLRRIRRRAVR